MKKIISFGKIDYNGSGRKNCEVTLEIELKKKIKSDVLSIRGNIWNPKKTDIYQGGQCLDTIKKHMARNPLFMKIYDIWKKWHLNDMHAGCEHQRNLGWEDDEYDKHLTEPCPECGYKFGTAWNFVELPKYVKKIINSL